MGANTVGDRAIEVRDYGKHQVRRMFNPVGAQRFYDRVVVETDGPEQKGQELRRQARPASTEDEVVGVS